MTKIKAQQKKSNIPLILMMFGIVMFGLVILYSVSGPAGYAKSVHDSAYYLKRQILWTVVGLIVALVISFIPVNFFKHPVIFFSAYFVSLGLAIAVRLFGSEINGAKRWILIGTWEFQPSELCKIGLIIALAGYREYIVRMRAQGKLQAKTGKSQTWNHAFFDFIIPVAACLLVDVFILFEPHFSCFLIIGVVVFMCTLNSGAGIRAWILGGLSILLVGVILGAAYIAINPNFRKNFAHVYQRLNVFAATSGDEEAEVTEDDTRQVTNAHNALGSGGMWGRGLGSSRAKYNYVSEAQNDYIFSIYVEETGFVGSVALLALFGALLVPGAWTAVVSSDGSGRLLALGVSTLVFAHVWTNIAMSIGLVPITGLPLPFISSGRTFLVTVMAGLGLVQSVSMHGREKRK